MKAGKEIDQDLMTRLQELKNIPPRNPQAAAISRAKFLSNVVANQPSNARNIRPHHLAWNAAVTLIIIITFLFGGTVSAVYAAQDSLPDSGLYPIKIWSEDIRLRVTSDPVQKIQLLMEFTKRRTGEINTLSANGKPIPLAVVKHLQKDIIQALKIVSALDNNSMESTLVRIQNQLIEQQQTLAGGSGDSASEVIQTQINLVGSGIKDPDSFRREIQEQNNPQTTEPPRTTMQPLTTPRAPAPPQRKGGEVTPVPAQTLPMPSMPGGESDSQGAATPGPPQGKGIPASP